MTYRVTFRSTVTVVLTTLLLVQGASALAQVGRYNPEERRAHQEKSPETKQAEKYPNATRQSPHLQATKPGGKALKELVDLLQAKDYPQAVAKADLLLASTDNAYERAFASQIAATASAESGNDAKAAVYFNQAIDANGLDNDDHFAALYNLGVTQYRLKQYPQALATLDRLSTETKGDPNEYAALRGNLLAELKRPAEAAAVYEQLYARNPADTKLLTNAVALYQQAGDTHKADALLLAAKGKGQLSDPAAYRSLYIGDINAGKLPEAIAAIDEGLAKGIVKPDKDLVDVYSVIAQTAYGNGDSKTAVDMYGRAATIASDGEPGLNLAKVLLNDGKVAEAKKAAQQALAKGLKNPAEAKRILAAGGK